MSCNICKNCNTICSLKISINNFEYECSNCKSI